MILWHFTSIQLSIIFLKGISVLERVEIIHKSKFLPGTVEKNSSTIRSSGRNSIRYLQQCTSVQGVAKKRSPPSKTVYLDHNGYK